MQKYAALFLVIAAAVAAGILAVRYFDRYQVASAVREQERRERQLLKAYSQTGVMDRIDCSYQPVGHVYVTEKFDTFSEDGLQRFLRAAWTVCVLDNPSTSSLKVNSLAGQTIGTWSPESGYTR